jgi:rare lipoprotein A
MTAAHKSLPFGYNVKVTNKKNGRAVTVTITDRGPYVKGRCVDLTRAGARALGFAGLAPVNVVPVVSDEP